MNHSSKAKRRISAGCALTLAPLAVGLTSCAGSDGNPLAGAPYDAGNQISVSAGEEGSTIDPSRPLKVTSNEGRIADVTAVDTAGRHLSGKLSEDGTKWQSTSPLAAGVRYTVRISTENGDGEQGRRTLNFQTKPAHAKRLGVTFGPDSGTYGVAQPVTAELSHKIKSPAQRRIVERALTVKSSPRVEGSWHWVDSKELHYRPKEYWPAHSTVSVSSRLKGLKIRKGLYGDKAKSLRLKTGDRVEAFADASGLSMKVKKDGRTIKEIPITTGKPGFETRNGTKVVLGRESFVRMRSSSVGIGGGESYDLGVHWATRLTWSGEYVHAAPWSSGSHGVSNSSHGCTGMSTGNAEWFFNLVRPGVPVTHSNSDGEQMAAFGNGFGDWNLSWKKWKEGSSLRPGAQDSGGSTADVSRLRPQV
ncbi:Lipoprotein-anchoring transpeptidase ErfK/SrfK [Streptomyces sp. WMMB 714]|jgi:lipoprotein-anchoring transpeptidase ErfK/SrfK|uniref:L,D-transpeptidase n=1 Tax=Streptomyces sp. WMMB 714 TaxID=1286822 RepID=UPI0005F870B6|nr:Ig-like domain-containing protein [Streptomyces sp. WMMB 714]SCK27552.1 Lipoprotein-anchoring transpeptidase ErfK/SrfK [Streptomyces sp. WMMB 714]